FLADPETIQFWEKEKVTGRIKRNNIQLLFHSIAIIKSLYSADDNNLSQLSVLYKQYFNRLKSEEDFTLFLKEVREFGSIYKENLLVDVGSFKFSEFEKRLFYILNSLDISTFHPFLLHLYKNNPNEVQKYFWDLEIFIIRRMIAGETTKNYNKLCVEFIEDPTQIRTEINSTPITMIEQGLKSISNNNAHVILFLIELYRRSKDQRYDQDSLNDNYTLEHIMPQKWEEHWNNIPMKLKPDGSQMSNSESRQDRFEKIYWLGNMTLLNVSLNASLRNFPLDRKINGEGKKKGMKEFSSLLITKNDIVEPFTKGEISSWTEDNIIKRTATFKDEVLEIWDTAKVI
ncbi:HNH endonuclease family protein, partial [Leptospira levettii]|uniref:HNH endonuclease family protein n=1 Tax=Leptospira levettii TaxID=2023178 RepID=UPI001EEB476E